MYRVKESKGKYRVQKKIFWIWWNVSKLYNSPNKAKWVMNQKSK